MPSGSQILSLISIPSHSPEMKNPEPLSSPPPAPKNNHRSSFFIDPSPLKCGNGVEDIVGLEGMHTANLQITPLAPARPIRTQIDPRTEPDDPTGYAIFMSQILYIIHRKTDTSDTSQILEYRNVIWVIKKWEFPHG